MSSSSSSWTEPPNPVRENAYFDVKFDNSDLLSGNKDILVKNDLVKNDPEIEIAFNNDFDPFDFPDIQNESVKAIERERRELFEKKRKEDEKMQLYNVKSLISDSTKSGFYNVQIAQKLNTKNKSLVEQNKIANNNLQQSLNFHPSAVIILNDEDSPDGKDNPNEDDFKFAEEEKIQQNALQQQYRFLQEFQYKSPLSVVNEDILFEHFDYVGVGMCTNRQDSQNQHLFGMKLMWNYQGCLEATIKEKYATGFSYSKNNGECFIHGWIFQYLQFPPWVETGASLTRSVPNYPNKNKKYLCYKRKKLLRTCSYPVGEPGGDRRLAKDRPCDEGLEIAQGAPCHVRCGLGTLPWPKVTTCMSNGQLEDAACYPYDVSNDEIVFKELLGEDATAEDILNENKANQLVEDRDLLTETGVGSWWYGFMKMGIEHQEVYDDYRQFLARIRFTYWDNMFPPAIPFEYDGVMATYYSPYEQIQLTKRMLTHDIDLVKLAFLTAWELPKQALEVSGVELVSLFHLKSGSAEFEYLGGGFSDEYAEEKVV